MDTDPRGPFRHVVSVEATSTANLTTLDCGHVRPFAPHFAPDRPGDRVRCFPCRVGTTEAERNALRDRLAADPVFAHRWLCHPGVECEDGCEVAAYPDHLEFYYSPREG